MTYPRNADTNAAHAAGFWAGLMICRELTRRGEMPSEAWINQAAFGPETDPPEAWLEALRDALAALATPSTPKEAT